MLSLLAPALVAAAESPVSLYQQECSAAIAAKGKISEIERFNKWLSFDWHHLLKENPILATEVGEASFNDRWPDLSRAAIDRRRSELDCPVKVAESIDRSQLPSALQLSYDLYLRSARQGLANARFPDELLQLSQIGGIHQAIVSILLSMPHTSPQDFAKILARLEKVPELLHQVTDLLREGLTQKVVPPAVVITLVAEQLAAMMPDDVTQSALYASLKETGSELSSRERQKIEARAKVIIKEKIYVALRELHQFLIGEYLPHANPSVAFESLPQGKAWYAALVRLYTTSALSPDEIHRIGLKEVKRIQGEMQKVMRQSGFKGDLAQFKHFLTTDPQFFFTSKDELLMHYRDIAKRIDPEVARFFGRLPRLPYGVQPVPEYSEKSQPAAYMEPGSLRAGRPGIFFANTYDLKSRPKWLMEALTLHESVPGHHLQTALADEMEAVPEFRKYQSYTAFVEGWGLYAESLGKELGLYKDPYSDFGRLSAESWRACRLVVDTGLHHLGWTRQRAIEFMTTHTNLPRKDIEVEVDRYIAIPGQALAYKLGELTFKKLREKARQALGNRFDVRPFHDALLADGALPLDVLEAKMDRWIASQKK